MHLGVLNVYLLTGNGTDAAPYFIPSINPFVSGNKVYLKYSFLVTNNLCIKHILQGGGFYYVFQNPIMNTWYPISIYITSTGGVPLFPQYYADAATANGKVMQIKEVIGLDLTATYGAGNEPTKEQMDHNLNKVWIDTTNTPKKFTAGGWVSF